MSKQGSEKRILHLECLIVPHITPDPLPLAFQAFLYCSPTTQTVGLKGRQMFEEKGVGREQNTPETKAKFIKRKQCKNQ